jgi:oxaloacetate decarboxylase (Na+ extruding) subunit alpha
MKKAAERVIAKKEKSENELHKIPLRITDTTLRDAHQSLWATRMRTDDVLRIIDVIDNVGYYSLECWGGATFDVCLRFLRENPWERLRQIKAKAHKTPLQMLLRGQNLVGYRNYADDVVDRFVALACENGMDIFRVFDALNDTRNLESAVRAVKKHGGHAQGTLCYTISPVHTIEKFVLYAREQVTLGIDSLCIKDMAGILSPIMAERLVTALVKEINVPIQIHCHASSGMATATYVDGVRAGAGAIDCAISSMAGFSSQPPVETLVTIFNETRYHANLDFEALEKVSTFFNELAPKRRQTHDFMPAIDPNILIHQIPGGMISNFRSQLTQQGMLDKLPQALEEVTRVREELGWCPLVTPTSQIVGAQATMNVITGERYKVVSNEVKNYLRGMYGRSPAPMNAELVKKVLGSEKPITHRPADDLKPQLPVATEGCDPRLIEHEEDIISYCILPEPSLEFFKWRATPPADRQPTPADLELSKNAPKAAEPAKTTPPTPAATAPAALEELLPPADYKGLTELMKSIKASEFDEFTIKKGAFNLTVRSSGALGKSVETGPAVVVEPAAPAAGAAPVKAEVAKAAPAVSTPAEKPAPAAASGTTIKAPLGGTFYSTGGPGKPRFCEVGASMKAGQTVCVVEAMKLFNEIKAQKDCKILEFLAKDGEAVVKDQPLVVIEEK